MPSLAELGLDTSARDDPLSYPGSLPEWSGLLVGDHYVELTAVPTRPVGQFDVVVRPSDPLDVGTETALTLDRALERLGRASVADRHPLLAVGSNAAPAQLRSKFERTGIPPVLPMLRGRVDGWRRTILAHVSIPGYLPISVERDGRARSMPVTLLLCDHDQLEVIDATEPNYCRLVAADAEPLTLDSGEVLTGYLVYVGRRGSVCDVDGASVDWSTQHDAITFVLSKLSDELRAACGPDPASFVRATAADHALRNRIGDHLAPERPPDLPTSVDTAPLYGDITVFG